MISRTCIGASRRMKKNDWLNYENDGSNENDMNICQGIREFRRAIAVVEPTSWSLASKHDVTFDALLCASVQSPLMINGSHQSSFAMMMTSLVV